MKTKKGRSSLNLLSLFPVAQAGFGQGLDGVEMPRGTFFTVATKFINFSVTAIGVLAVIIFIYAGFMYLTASGDESKISKAKSTMTYAIVGIIVSLMGFVVVKTIDMITK